MGKLNQGFFFTILKLMYFKNFVNKILKDHNKYIIWIYKQIGS